MDMSFYGYIALITTYTDISPLYTKDIDYIIDFVYTGCCVPVI